MSQLTTAVVDKMKAWIFVSYTKGLADLGTMPFLADQNQNDE